MAPESINVKVNEVAQALVLEAPEITEAGTIIDVRNCLVKVFALATDPLNKRILNVVYCYLSGGEDIPDNGQQDVEMFLRSMKTSADIGLMLSSFVAKEQKARTEMTEILAEARIILKRIQGSLNLDLIDLDDIVFVQRTQNGSGYTLSHPISPYSPGIVMKAILHLSGERYLRNAVNMVVELVVHESLHKNGIVNGGLRRYIGDEGLDLPQAQRDALELATQFWTMLNLKNLDVVSMKTMDEIPYKSHGYMPLLHVAIALAKAGIGDNFLVISQQQDPELILRTIDQFLAEHGERVLQYLEEQFALDADRCNSLLEYNGLSLEMILTEIGAYAQDVGGALPLSKFVFAQNVRGILGVDPSLNVTEVIGQYLDTKEKRIAAFRSYKSSKEK